jgi:hypothetical protein
MIFIRSMEGEIVYQSIDYDRDTYHFTTTEGRV